MPREITTLTPAHIARIPEWVERWTAVGLSTEPADFDAAEAAGRACYRAAGLPEPMVVLRMGSPYAATVGGWLAVELLEQAYGPLSPPWERPTGGRVDQLIRQQVEQQIRQQVEHQVRQQVESQVRQPVAQLIRQQVGQRVEERLWRRLNHATARAIDRQVDQLVWQQVWHQVGEPVHRRVRAPVESQVQQAVGEQTWRQIGDRWADHRGASLWAARYACITFLRDVVGWEDESLTAFARDEQLALSCGWTWWDGAVLAISDRPESITFDAEDRLRGIADGPAIRYRDGWSIRGG